MEKENEETEETEQAEGMKALMRLVWFNTNLLIVSILIAVNALLAIWLKVFMFQVLGLLLSCGAIYFFWNRLNSKIEPLLK